MKLFRICAAVMLALTLGLAGAAEAQEKQEQEKMKVVYHVADLEKVGFALGNMVNHIEGAGGPDKVELVLVAHGPALQAFHTMGGDPKIADRVAALQGKGVHFEACGNTMTAQKVALDDLVAGFARRDEGGVVRIAQLQSEGYLYIRP